MSNPISNNMGPEFIVLHNSVNRPNENYFFEPNNQSNSNVNIGLQPAPLLPSRLSQNNYFPELKSPNNSNGKNGLQPIPVIHSRLPLNNYFPEANNQNIPNVHNGNNRKFYDSEAFVTVAERNNPPLLDHNLHREHHIDRNFLLKRYLEKRQNEPTLRDNIDIKVNTAASFHNNFIKLEDNVHRNKHNMSNFRTDYISNFENLKNKIQKEEKIEKKSISAEDVKSEFSKECQKMDFECSLCLDIFKNVTMIQNCFHRFCKECITDIIKNKEDSPCPMCMEKFTPNQLKHDFNTQRLIDTIWKEKFEKAGLVVEENPYRHVK